MGHLQETVVSSAELKWLWIRPVGTSFSRDDMWPTWPSHSQAGDCSERSLLLSLRACWFESRLRALSQQPSRSPGRWLTGRGTITSLNNWKVEPCRTQKSVSHLGRSNQILWLCAQDETFIKTLLKNWGAIETETEHFERVGCTLADKAQIFQRCSLYAHLEIGVLQVYGGHEVTLVALRTKAAVFILNGVCRMNSFRWEWSVTGLRLPIPFPIGRGD